MPTAIRQNVELSMPKILSVGTFAPYFSGLDQHGNFQSKDRLCKDGPFVLIFYRGHWCYFCRKQIAMFQQGLDKMNSDGFPVILVSPEKPKYIAQTIKRTKTTFPVLHDSYNYIMKNYKVAKAAPKEMYVGLKKINLTEINDTENPVLPVPATYIIGKDGIIKYGELNANFMLRTSFQTIADKVKEYQA